MRKLLVFFIFFSVAGFTFFILTQHKYKIIEYSLEGKNYRLYLADTPKKWQRGLMYKKYNDLLAKKIDGMLFVFPKKFVPVFYNKNTYIDLDVYWINGSSVVGKSFLPSIKNSRIIVEIISPSEVDKVAEVIKKQ